VLSLIIPTSHGVQQAIADGGRVGLQPLDHESITNESCTPEVATIDDSTRDNIAVGELNGLFWPVNP